MTHGAQLRARFRLILDLGSGVLAMETEAKYVASSILDPRERHLIMDKIPSQRLQIVDARALSLRGYQVLLPMQLVNLSIKLFQVSRYIFQ